MIWQCTDSKKISSEKGNVVYWLHITVVKKYDVNDLRLLRCDKSRKKNHLWFMDDYLLMVY